MGKGKSIKINYIYNAFNQLLSIAVPLVTTPYLTRVLGATNLGIFSYAYSIVYYFSLFVLLGVNNYGNRCIAKVNDSREERSKEFWSIYLFQIFMLIIMLVIYGVYTVVASDNRVLSIIMLVFLLSSGIDINWLFFGMEEFKITTIRSCILKMLTLLGIFMFVKSQDDVYKYAVVFVLGTFVSQLVLWINLGKHIDFKRVTLAEVKRHIKPNLVLFVPVLAISLYQVMDKVMLGMMSTKDELGYYDSCEKIMQVPVVLVFSLGTVMLPRITNLLAHNDKKTCEKYLEKSILFAIALSSPMSLGLMGVSKEFVPFFYGEGFERCITLFHYLLPSCLFLAFANVVRTQLLIPNSRDKVYIVSVFSGAGINLVLNIILIGQMGAAGASLATLVAEIVVCLVQSIAVIRDTHIVKYALEIIPIVLLGIAMYFVIYNLSIVGKSVLTSLIVKIVFGGTIYVVGLGVLFFVYRRLKKSDE